MKGFIHTAIATVPAALIAGAFLTGAAAPASAQTDEWCNPVMQVIAKDTAVTSSGGSNVIHAGSVKCPPSAAATPAAARAQTEYLVFFDWNKADITPAAQRTIQDAVNTFGKGPSARVHVIGHTDTSGSPAYNQRLSVRRAESVKRSLVNLGIPAANVTTEGRGESQLLVQTGPNVREPSNRRAQILNRGASAPAS